MRTGIFFHLLLLMCGIFACSTAVIFIRFSNEHTVLLSAWRLVVAAAVLTPLFARDWRAHRDAYPASEMRRSVLPGIALALHFLTWIAAARMTPAANASLLVNLVPVAMPFLLHFLVAEKITRAEWFGTVLAVGGTFVLSAADFRISRVYFWGDLLCLVSMLLFAAYLALGRRYRATPTTWLYVVPLYWFAGFFCLVVSVFFVNPIKTYAPKEILWILCLALIPTVIGHSILNYALKHIRGQAVSVLNLAQFIFAGVMGFFLLNETPPGAFYAASALVIAGCVVAIRGHRE